MSETMTVFNRQTVRRHRARAAKRGAAGSGDDFLFSETAVRLADRLQDVTRTFPLALDLGCHAGPLAKTLIGPLGGKNGIDTLVQCDLAPEMAAAVSGLRLAADEEAIPFGPDTFDLVLSNLSLHWVNDLPGALLQIRHALKPDGLFLGAMLGGETLKELRQALSEAEIAQENGLSPRVSPMAGVRDLGGLLQRAGFALPVVDTQTITVMYSDPMTLLADLRAMGESSALIEGRKGLMRRATLAAAMVRYRELFTDKDGAIPATFEILTMTGWAPDASQQQALKPGSAEASLADALKKE